MSRASFLAATVLAVLLSACIKHPPEATTAAPETITTVRWPEGPVASWAEADTSVVYLVVDRHWEEENPLSLRPDTTRCRDVREVCSGGIYDGKIEGKILTIRPKDELLNTAPATPSQVSLRSVEPNWIGLQSEVDRLRDRAFQARLNENWRLANELDSQAFWLQYEIDRLRWWGRYGWNGQH